MTNACYKGVLFEKAKEVIDKSINIRVINAIMHRAKETNVHDECSILLLKKTRAEFIRELGITQESNAINAITGT